MGAYIVLGIVAAAFWWLNREARIVFGPGGWTSPDYESSEYGSGFSDYGLFDSDGGSIDIESNPATGLPMVGGTDTAGNPYGCNSSWDD